MTMTFTPFDMNEAFLDDLRRATGMEALQTVAFEWLASLFELHNKYSRNPFWGNPETKAPLLAMAKEAESTSDFRKIKGLVSDIKRITGSIEKAGSIKIQPLDNKRSRSVVINSILNCLG